MAALWHRLPLYRSLLQRSVCPSIWTGWLGRAAEGKDPPPPPRVLLRAAEGPLPPHPPSRPRGFHPCFFNSVN